MSTSFNFPVGVRQRYPQGPHKYDLMIAQRVAAIVAGEHATVEPNGSSKRFLINGGKEWVLDVDPEDGTYTLQWSKGIGNDSLLRHYKGVIVHQLGFQQVNPDHPSKKTSVEAMAS